MTVGVRMAYSATIICIGFGEFKGRCDQPAGAAATAYWCERCFQLQQTTVRAALEDILARRKLRGRAGAQ